MVRWDRNAFIFNVRALAPYLLGWVGGNMRGAIMTLARVASGSLLAVLLSAGGQRAEKIQFGQPKSVIHVVAIRWNPGVSESDKQKVIEGVKEMAATIPGIKNVWLESDRVQPNDLNDAFAIEFENRAFADAYAENSAHKAWTQTYLPLRAESFSIQISNR